MNLSSARSQFYNLDRVLLSPILSFLIYKMGTMLVFTP